MKFAVFGGDQRIVQLCRLLAEDGHRVSSFALDKAGPLTGVAAAASFREAAEKADCVVLPLPAARQRGLLNTPLSAGEYPLEDAIGAIEPHSCVCAGMVDRDTAALAATQNLTLTDYLLREELAIKNAAATVEGALSLLIQETPVTLWDSRILVLGFGRIGKLLAHRLRGMGAEVTVSARNFGDLAWIRALGYKSLDTRALEGKLGGFDCVVNTVPSPILTEALLKELDPGCFCLDLASKPGGMDFAAASRLGIRALWALGLPAEVAPVSAGAIIRDTIYNILEEQNGKT